MKNCDSVRAYRFTKNRDTPGTPGHGADWSVADWIKLTALSLLISIAITAIVAATASAIWWWLLR
jgi:hypothetical protein